MVSHLLKQALASAGSPTTVAVKEAAVHPLMVAKPKRNRNGAKPPALKKGLHLTADFTQETLDEISAVTYPWADSRVLTKAISTNKLSFTIKDGNDSLSGTVVFVKDGRFVDKKGKFLNEIDSIAVPLGISKLALRFISIFEAETMKNYINLM